VSGILVAQEREGWMPATRAIATKLTQLFLPLALLFMSHSASADAFYVLVGYDCDKEKDQLHITYDGSYNEVGKSAKQGKDKGWDLITAKDEDHIGSLKTVRAKCRLSNGTYEIALTPSPGNFNVQGRCGAWMTAGAKVTKNKKVVYSIDRFDKDCIAVEPVITRITISPTLVNPKVTSVSWDDFYQ
jgi:hypothetical protein